MLLEFGSVHKEVRYIQIVDAILISVLSAGKHIPEEDKANREEVLVRQFEDKGADDQSPCSHWACHLYQHLPWISLPLWFIICI